MIGTVSVSFSHYFIVWWGTTHYRTAAVHVELLALTSCMCELFTEAVSNCCVFVSVFLACVFFMQMPATSYCYSGGWGENTNILIYSVCSVDLFVSLHSFSVVGFCKHLRCLGKNVQSVHFLSCTRKHSQKINFRFDCARIHAPSACTQPSQAREECSRYSS